MASTFDLTYYSMRARMRPADSEVSLPVTDDDAAGVHPVERIYSPS